MAVKIADKIRRARLNAGLSQGELADLSGVDRATLSRWETGKAKPTKTMMSKLAPHLGITDEDRSKASREMARIAETERAAYVQALGYFMVQKKMSAEELARKSGVTESVISGIRNGKLPCVDPWLTPLARALGVKPGDIYNNVPGTCEYIGEGLKDLEKKYPVPERPIDLWGGTTMVVDIACGTCGWCGKSHEGLACKEDDVD